MSRTVGLALLVVIFSWTSSAPAQIDHRVNQGNAATGGYALDKNPQVGSGGFNLSRPTGYDFGAQANAIITGNVTGLGSFHGPIPTQQANQFRSDLPSTYLSGFDARSVGLSKIGANRPPLQTYYFDPNRTVADLGQIRQGLNQPGSSQLSSTATSPLQSVNQPLRVGPNVRDPADTRSQLDVPPTPYGVRQSPVLRERRPRPVDSVAPVFKAAAESPIFGTALPENDARIPLPNVDFRTDQIQVGPTWDELGKLEANRTLPAGAKTAEKPAGFEREPLKEAALTGAAPPTEKKVPAIELNQPMPLNGQAPSNLGADRFADLYSAIRAADQLGVEKMGFQPTPQAAQEPEKAGGRSDLVRKTTEGLNQLGTAAKWAKDVLDNPVTTFVGRNENRLNEYMASGEEAMRQGEYYKASRFFGLASSIDVVNPLPYLNRGHALAAAGDYVSAVRSLDQGIRLFPHIAAFKLDLVGMVGQRDVFDVRRADLEARLAVREQYELRFLLGYLELYSGLAEEGMKNLRMAAKEAPVDSPISSFADLVAGDRPLPPLAK